MINWRKCTYYSEYWLNEWLGDRNAFNPNKRYLINQLLRPTEDLMKFISRHRLEEVLVNRWEYNRYMAYVAKVVESGNVYAVNALDLEGILICCGQSMASRLLVWSTPFPASPATCSVRDMLR